MNKFSFLGHLLRLDHAAITLAAALALTACTQDEYVGGGAGSDGNIRFDNAVREMKATRGVVTTLAKLTSFGVSAGVYDAASTYASGPCGNYFRNIEVETATGETTYLWPASQYRIAFYAYYPYNHTNISLADGATTGRMQYTYTVPSAPADQVDLMTAEVTDVACPSTDPVALTFDHKLADFRFYLDNSLAKTIKVNSISISGFQGTGTLTGSSWNTSGDAKTYTLTVGEDMPSGSHLDLTGTTNHFMLIPQSVPSSTRMLDLNITADGVTNHFYYDLTAAFNADMGSSYCFTLRLTSSLEVDPSSDIDEWVMEIGIMSYATATTDPWSPSDQPMDKATNGGITVWEREN